MAALTSGMFRPVTTAAAAKSGVPARLPFCLFDALDSAAFSITDCVEFCLALEDAGLPFVGGGDPRADSFESGKVVLIGDDANDGDIADVTVLFLFHVSS